MQENTFKNEMFINLGDKKILLRPTFENISRMESDLGGVAYLAFKYGQGVDLNSKTVDHLKSAKSLPPMSEAAKIIYYNQAEKQYTVEEIFDMCQQTGLRVCAEIVLFLVKITAGNKFAKKPSERQKKNSVNKSQVENP